VQLRDAEFIVRGSIATKLKRRVEPTDSKNKPKKFV
jgi:hypothetical protein